MDIHERIDLGRWTSMFSLDQLREKARHFVDTRARERPKEYPNAEERERHVKLMSPGGEIITGPRDLAVVEQLREEVFSKASAGQRIPTDVFVFGAGEPTRREVTKFGGLPYREAGKPWPRSPAGEPLLFIGQICFADSRDLVGTIPGDILLIYAHELSCEPNLEFEWVTIGAFKNAVQSGEVPTKWSPVEPVFGTIHRTHDFPDDRPRFRAYNQSFTISVLEGTKIGGVPRWIQVDESPSGRFLGTLGPIQPVQDWPYPFLNTPEPMTFRDVCARTNLMFGDMGSVYLFLDGNRVRWILQCY